LRRMNLCRRRVLEMIGQSGDKVDGVVLGTEADRRI
jgi:hypothetical protein